MAPVGGDPVSAASAVRAGIIAQVLRDGAPLHSAADLAAALGVQRSAVQRELQRLTTAGFLRRPAHQRRRSAAMFEVDPGQAGLADLRRFVQVSVDQAGIIRDAIVSVAPTSLAWIHGRYADGDLVARQISLVVLAAERRLVAETLAAVQSRLSFTVRSDVMSLAEWSYRLERKEIRVMAIRRARRLWLIGNDRHLRDAERAEIGDRAMRKAAIANWRDEVDWDDDYDPFRMIGEPRA